jgi:aspartyl-tRNA(Asn)/glutamyl-tRNA(Gln) amidotransferase subunit A
MTTTAEATVINRLRANLQAAGVPATEEMIAEIIDKGFLQIPLAFDALARGEGIDLVPDYLADWDQEVTLANTKLGEATAPTPAANSLSAATQALHQGSLSPVELTEQALARLTDRDPVLNAFQLVLADQARAAAKAAEAEIRTGNYRGPLHGIPVAIKDLLHYAGTPTTAGSKVRPSQPETEHAAAVELLERAGAIIIGKTRLSEFAYAPSSINPNYGPTRNPRALEHDTGGSSSGSAAAVADDIVFAALGSDTGGSIRIPAANCGLTGLKPTFGRISLYGAINLSWSLDHLGPLTRTVADAALVLGVLAGADARDPRTRAAPPVPVESIVGQEPNVQGLRIGVLGDDGAGKALASDEAVAAWRAGLATLEAAGATLVEIDLPEMPAMRVVGATILAQEALAYHQPTLRTGLADYGAFMRTRILAAYAHDYGAFVRANQLRTVLRRRVETCLAQIDLLSTPTLPAAAPPLGALSAVTLTLPFNLLGWPALTVPVSVTAAGLPLGLQLVGKAWDEATVLRAGLALEAGLG